MCITVIPIEGGRRYYNNMHPVQNKSTIALNFEISPTFDELDEFALRTVHLFRIDSQILMFRQRFNYREQVKL